MKTKKMRFDFPFYGGRGSGEIALRYKLVCLLNECQNKYTFGIFTTNATKFHSDGCIYAVKKGTIAYNRKSETVVFCHEYGASIPSVFSDGVTNFDRAYIHAREFIAENCGI